MPWITFLNALGCLRHRGEALVPTVTTDLGLMRFHVEALFTHDANSDLVAVNEPNGAPAPRFFIGRTREGIVCRFRRDLDLETRRALRAACDLQMARPQPLDMPTDPLPYQEI